MQFAELLKDIQSLKPMNSGWSKRGFGAGTHGRHLNRRSLEVYRQNQSIKIALFVNKDRLYARCSVCITQAVTPLTPVVGIWPFGTIKSVSFRRDLHRLCIKPAICYRVDMSTNRILKISAWVSLALALSITLLPLQMHTALSVPLEIERILLFAIMTALFVIAYPQHFTLCALLLILGACTVELFQYLSPARHPQAIDASLRAAGAALGVCVGWALNRRRAVAPPPSSRDHAV